MHLLHLHLLLKTEEKDDGPNANTVITAPACDSQHKIIMFSSFTHQQHFNTSSNSKLSHNSGSDWDTWDGSPPLVE